MNPFPKSAHQPKLSTVGRAPVIAIALLFLVTALLSALPSREEIYKLFDQAAMAGYEAQSETTPLRSSVLGEYYDTPATSPVPEQDDTVSESGLLPAGSERASL